jgi:hypothetical protein
MRDLRQLPLIERKIRLERLMPKVESRVRTDGAQTSWVKIKNATNSQLEGDTSCLRSAAARDAR